MKQLITLMSLLLTVFSINLDCQGAIITSVAVSGSWKTAGSWDLGRIPTCGDTIIIPFGSAINITNSVNLDSGSPLCSAVRIQIFGTLSFNNGRKLDLAAGACLSVELGGLINPSPTGGGASESISIDGTNVWQASDGPLAGLATLGCPVILPVTLISINISQDDLAYYLNWNVYEEKNVSHYNVFISENGYNWEKNITVQANGNPSYKTRLTFPADMQEFYIKLESVDVDGKVFVLAIENVKADISSLSSLNELTIFPNPTARNSNTNIVFELNSATNILLQVIDFTGKVILEKIFETEKGQNLIPIETSEFKQGNYVVFLKTNETTLNKKLIVL